MSPLHRPKPPLIGWEYLDPLHEKWKRVSRRRALWSRRAAEAWSSRHYARARLAVLEGRS
ncbi:hypothetical protein [Tropicimonas sp. IMCC6043]|uniref:hypothetical protein n=1 Tax=Tropicimonas sp. IMCC6043 TaxID=2510645 RepID=UPI00101B7572|nr:hypothetical protein [Tropicimonas sp. IMCC6043]RYH07782.1 hypothetical protein EU800_18845 [Tropicimonas sp. IMCC6043]